jgi:hypothetical protein
VSGATTLPPWAERVVRTVAREHHKRVPQVGWRRYSARARTSGRALGDDENSISLTDVRRGRMQFLVGGQSCSKFAKGTARLSARVTLLHELAHWLTGDGHTLRFWTVAFQLYRRFRIPMGYALRDEALYKQGALDGYWAGRDRRGRRALTHVHVKTRVHAGPSD